VTARDFVGRTIDGWLIVSPLGQGGMGAVYRVRNDALGREGALKVLAASGGPKSSATARLQREMAVLAGLSHPGIVRFLGSGALGESVPYYVMELVPGRSLEEIMTREERLEPRRAAELCAGIARALGHAHARGVVHRDMKPSNVMVREDDTPVVLDFGLAKALEGEEAERLTRTGQLLGTVSYMSPEQAGGAKSIGPASDVFSLGVLLYELLSGTPPFEGESTFSILAKIMTEAPVPLRRVAADTPAPLAAICDKAMAKDPGARYPNGDALAEDLERFLAGGAVAARGRRPVALVAAGTIVVVVAGGAATIALRGSAPEAPPTPARASAPAAPDEKTALSLAASGRGAEAAPMLDQLLATADDRAPATARLRLARARIRAAAGRPEEALADLESAGRALGATDDPSLRDPLFARSYVARGRRRHERDDEDGAAADFRKAAELDRDALGGDVARSAADALERAGLAHLRRIVADAAPASPPSADQVREAHADLDLALALDPARPKATDEVVQVEKRLGALPFRMPAVRFQVAARLRRLGVPFDAQKEIPLFRRDEGFGAYEDALRKRLAAAGADAKRVVAAYRNFSHSVDRDHAVPEVAFEAEEEFRAVCPRDRWFEWCIARGRTLVGLGRKEDGMKLLDEAVGLTEGLDHESRGDALFWRGSYQAAVNRNDRAVEDLEASLEQGRLAGKPPGNGWVYMSMAKSLHVLGREEECLRAIADARKLGGIIDDQAAKLEAAARAAIADRAKRSP
jgi:serine/threonine-protein kinase